ncbi:MAG: hypothetical protein HQL90_10690 [Magnetococcales bacterium]|nr:hypothetical protein [Magnetococcales bacterium]
MNRPPHGCDIYWPESEFIPIDLIMEHWCSNDPNCVKAKNFALMGACDRGEIAYMRSDGRDFGETVRELFEQRRMSLLMIHRASFMAWAAKFPDWNTGFMPRETETQFRDRAAQMAVTMLGKHLCASGKNSDLNVVVNTLLERPEWQGAFTAQRLLRVVKKNW